MRRILIVDDQPTIRLLVRSVVAGWSEDAEIIEACDGMEALEMLGKRTFDFVICDIDMPNMNGIDLLQKIRNTTYNRDLPILMVTGSEDAEMISTALKRGATGYLTKPFNMDELIEALQICTDWDLRKIPQMNNYQA